MINVGLVGFGLSGRYLQAPFFLINPNFRLAKIVTSQMLPENIFPETQQVNSIEDLLNDSSIDLISICSPNNTHFDYAKRALEQGKHVLVEKPISPKLSQARELFEIANKQNLVLGVFQNRRFDSDFLTVKQVIESGVLGEILSYEAHFDRYKPLLNKKAWKETPTEGSGILYDLGAHLVDQAIYLFGTPESYNGDVFIQRQNSLIDDAFNLNLSFGKVKANLKSSLMVKEQGPKYTVHGTLGTFTKYGLDIQEDQLVGGMWPFQPDFGVEPDNFNGKLTTNFKGLDFSGKVSTLAGNWNLLFENLAFSIINGKENLITKPEEILIQIEVLENLTKR